MNDPGMVGAKGTSVSTPIRVSLLGPFAVSDGGGGALVLPKKAQALLGFLLLEGARAIGRDELSALLWSNTGSEQARQSLRQCLTVLRKSLPDGSILGQSDRLAFSRTPELTSDIYEWEQLYQPDSLADNLAADALHRGEFLAGLSLQHEPFEDWVANERRRFTDARQNLLTRIAVQQAQSGGFAAAVGTARRLTALDPFREDSRRLLMELLAASGERGLALVEHARVDRMLREELQAAPEPATQQLAQKIRRGQSVQSQWAQASAQQPPAVAASDKSFRATAPPPHFVVPDRPTIALLPLVNLTGDPAENDFIQAVMEDVTSALIRGRWPFSVLMPMTHLPGSARLGNEATARGARYTASGSIRRDGKRVRAVVHLVDAAQERQLWSTKVDVEGYQSFALCDLLSQQIVSKLAAAVRTAEIQRSSWKPIEELSACDLYLRAQAVCRRGPKGNETALRLLDRAIELDPEFAVAHALSARCLHLKRLMGWVHPEEPRLYEAVRSAHQALEIDASNPEALWMAGLALANIDGNMSDGQHLVDRSLAINPNDASAWIGSCFIRAHSGDTDTALQHFERAQQINAEDGSQHVQWHAAAMTHFIAGRFEEADAATDTALAEQPGYPGSLRIKVATSALLGRIDLAQHAGRKLLLANPGANIASVRSYWRLWTHTEHAAAAMVDGWQRTGMPEG